MNVFVMAIFWVYIICFAYVMLLSYGELLRLGLSLLQLANFADKMRLPSKSRYVHISSLAPVTVVLPQCQNAKDSVEYVCQHLQLDYPTHEVIAICDGTKNSAFKKMAEALQLVKIDQPIKLSVPQGAVRGVYRSPLWENLIVVDKVQGGHYDELNCAVNLSRYPLLVTVSPNRWLFGENLWHLARPLMLRYNTLAVGSLPRFSGVFQGVFAQLQQTVLLKAYPAGIAVPGQKSLPIVPEGFGAFRKSAVIKAGGFAKNGAGLEMAAQLFATHPLESATVQLLPQAAYQVMPQQGFYAFWQNCLSLQGQIQSTLWRCRKMLLRPKYGRTGLFGLPMHMLINVAGPILEVLGMVLGIWLFAFGYIGGPIFWGFWAIYIFFSMLTTLAAVLSQQVQEKDSFSMQRLLRHLGCAIIYPLGFRQLLAFMRTAAIFANIFSRKRSVL